MFVHPKITIRNNAFDKNLSKRSEYEIVRPIRYRTTSEFSCAFAEVLNVTTPYHRGYS